MTLLIIIRLKYIDENCNIIITAITIITKHRFDLIVQSEEIHSGLQITMYCILCACVGL